MKHLCLCIWMFCGLNAWSQKLDEQREYYLSAIGFWNVENLYDTLNDPWKNDDEYTPDGERRWTGERYRTKIEHLATVINQMATDVTPDGLALLGLCEVENKKVLEDLIRSPQLKERKYQFIHLEGPDARGIDPAFIYNPNYFTVKEARDYRVKLVVDSTHKTRNILLVSGLFLGEPVIILVNHWPSRRGGEKLSRPNRNAAAKVARQIADSVLKVNPDAKLLIMGDLNDDPVNESVKKHLGTYGAIKEPKLGLFFNPMEKLYYRGIGTLAWRDSWNLFDQIVMSCNWTTGDFKTWHYYRARVFNKEFLKADFGNYKGYPFRTYSGHTYTGGYSDHFPAYIIVAKEKQEKQIDK